MFYDIIPDMVSNKKLNPIVAELFISDISFIFVTHNLILLYQKYLVKFYALFEITIPNKRELQQFAFNHSSERLCDSS